MADVTVTAGSVLAGSGAIKKSVVAGATITAGKPVYKGTASTYLAAVATSSAAASAEGFALNGASAGQPMTILTGGALTAGGTLAVGETYYVSTNAGGICPSGDLTTNHYIRVVGVARTTAVLDVFQLTTTPVKKA